MSHWITLDTSHGPVEAWQAMPSQPAQAGLVVIQEIFGVNEHIRAVAERFAAAGFAVLAPAFFDPIRKDVELDYSESGFAEGRRLMEALGFDAALDIVAAARDALRPIENIGTVGYCWGGTVALLAALRLDLPSVSYYGARNVQFLDETPRAPIMFHFGENDTSIPVEMIREHRRKMPQMQTFIYPAGHAFNRDVDARAYDRASADLAYRRTLDFLTEHLQ